MKLKDVDWSVLRFTDRGILPKDLKLMSADQRHALGELEVEKIDGKRYKVVVDRK
ncbi:MAG: hypothetical protein HFG70_16415 [Hungatella sp.]|nr:hypothetical protein [Hungatella sp.]